MKNIEEKIGTRLSLLVKNSGLPQGIFAESVEISGSYFSQIVNDKKPLSLPQALKISEKYGVSLNWLLNGTGEIYLKDDLTNTFMLSDNGSNYDAGAFGYVPMAAPKLSAGGGECVIEDALTGQNYAFRKEWLRTISANNKELVLMKVRGDSMRPTIEDGDMVLIDRGLTRPESGEIHAIGIDDTISVKRIDVLPGGICRILSDNRDAYPHVDVPCADVRIIGRVLWIGRELKRNGG